MYTITQVILMHAPKYEQMRKDFNRYALILCAQEPIRILSDCQGDVEISYFVKQAATRKQGLADVTGLFLR